MICRTEFKARLPPVLRRWRTFLPLEASGSIHESWQRLFTGLGGIFFDGSVMFTNF